MSDKPRQMKLAVFVNNAGAHPSGWRLAAADPGGLHDIEFYKLIAQTAERAKFDMFFMGDAQGYRHIEGREAYASSDNAGKLEPTTMLGALAMVTDRIGLVATCSTTYNEPYALARRFASLDHISHGRAGWNVVTSTSNSEARNFGREVNMEHDTRYERADEFVEVVKRLWDSWEQDAILADQEAGVYFDASKVHATNYEGRFFKVEGPLNVCRTPQGRPVIVQAGASGPGRSLAARTADIVFTAQPSLEAAKKFYGEMKQLVADAGRDPAQMNIVPSMQLIVRSTEAEVRAVQAELSELIPASLALSSLQMLLGSFDLSAYPLDGPLPEIPLTNGSQWVQQSIIKMAREENLTILQLARRAAVSRSAMPFAGTPEQVADLLQTWFEERAADGFSITPPYLPGGIIEFCDLVVPILQKRGLFRTEYEGATLREHLGLSEPQNMYVAHPEMHREPRFWGSVASQGGGE
jgi:FMN-dependent oxidoreductase (nitrilotriacetate monooxygenase family)